MRRHFLTWRNLSCLKDDDNFMNEYCSKPDYDYAGKSDLLLLYIGHLLWHCVYCECINIQNRSGAGRISDVHSITEGLQPQPETDQFPDVNFPINYRDRSRIIIQKPYECKKKTTQQQQRPSLVKKGSCVIGSFSSLAPLLPLWDFRFSSNSAFTRVYMRTHTYTVRCKCCS